MKTQNGQNGENRAWNGRAEQETAKGGKLTQGKQETGRLAESTIIKGDRAADDAPGRDNASADAAKRGNDAVRNVRKCGQAARNVSEDSKLTQEVGRLAEDTIKGGETAGNGKPTGTAWFGKATGDMSKGGKAENDAPEVSEPADDAAEREPEAKADDIEKSGGITTHNRGGTIHAMIIAGQIEGHYAAAAQTKSTKYEQCIPTLVAVEESDEIDGLLLLLNTIGGDVEAGLAIAELISGMRKPTVSLVLGGGHSIGVPLAVSAKRSFIVPSATMTLHPVRMSGLVIGVPQTFANFTKMQDRILDFIVRNSRADGRRLRELMMSTDEMTTDIGTIVDGNEAVSLGLIDTVGGLGEALAALKEMIAQQKGR